MEAFRGRSARIDASSLSPQDRVSLTESKAGFRMALEGMLPESDDCDEAGEESFPASAPPLISKAMTAPAPSGAYFAAFSNHRLQGRLA